MSRIFAVPSILIGGALRVLPSRIAISTSRAWLGGTDAADSPCWSKTVVQTAGRVASTLTGGRFLRSSTCAASYCPWRRPASGPSGAMCHNRADAAAFRSGLGAYLIESNFPHAYAVFCLRICFIHILDMKALEIDRFLLSGRRRRSPRYRRFSAIGIDDDHDNRDNGDANGGEAKRPCFWKKKCQRHQDQDHDP